jgi:molybdopterin-synthase adenylyltransferase
MSESNRDRYSRNLGLLGVAGQDRIETISVAIVGFGGLGSHVAQQLAYLGCRRLLVLDPDVVDESNLNRLIGAGPQDVRARKVDVATRLIHDISPNAEVAALAHAVNTQGSIEALAAVDCVFGCIDNDEARLELTEISSAHQIPYFDLASDTGGEGEPIWIGGRVFVSIHGERCLSCAGELDQRALALSAMTGELRDADARIYGVPRTELGQTGPMVVSINGVVASLAVTEFTVWVAGIRPPKGHLVYRGDLGTVTSRIENRTTTCYYCDTLWRGSY